jgi:hypothetical protein
MEASELKEFQFAENMCLFIDNILQEQSQNMNRFFDQTNGLLLCRCYPVGNGMETGEFLNKSDRIFQISANVSYLEMQETVDEKFNAKGCYLHFIGE